MTENLQTPKRSYSADWFVQGVLTRIGDALDRLTGRGWKPSSSLATSELTERLKKLLDSEVRENGDERRYVPHNIKLKMQWDKFSTDAEDSLDKLRSELLIAAVDHINDRRYYTYAPISLEVKPDYFTSGVKLFVSFDTFEEEHEAEVSVSIPGMKAAAILPEDVAAGSAGELRVRFTAGEKPYERMLAIQEGKRISIGRGKENDIVVDDPSVSKFHASLVLSPAARLMVADTGSTNGTFVGGERIAYGKAIELQAIAEVKFGSVMMSIAFEPDSLSQPVPNMDVPPTETYTVGDLEFTTRNENIGSARTQAGSDSEEKIDRSSN